MINNNAFITDTDYNMLSFVSHHFLCDFSVNRLVFAHVAKAEIVQRRPRLIINYSNDFLAHAINEGTKAVKRYVDSKQ